ncbi:hypothetical protein GCM10009687_72770 [Asanoa iriomotensis]|uniref:Uncharacterized protein n=1 Tax=Asanoa iriomotensis TaxID=234613 RepID=A0ABQ4C6E1_9ACTN|nr:hypothetical protein Air01nite_44420 [Asanoa iriomotensis]
MPQAQDIATGKRIGKRATLDHGGGVGPVDLPDQRLKLIEHRACFGQEGSGVLSRRLAFLKTRAADDPGAELFSATRRIRAQREGLGKFHEHQYASQDRHRAAFSVSSNSACRRAPGLRQ